MNQFVDDPFPEGMVEEWQKFLDQSHNVLDIFNTGTLFPLQRPAEMLAMLKLADASKPKTYMEIGADKGGGLWAWCHWMPSLEQVIACEIRGLPYAELFERAFPRIKFLWLPDSSYHFDTVETVKEWLTDLPTCNGTVIDVLFIDGDKSWFLKDFDAYLPMVRSGGIVFMHDITDPAPGEAFQAVKDRGYRIEEIVDRSDLAMLPGTDRPRTAHQSWLAHWNGASCGVGVVHVPK